MRRIIHIDMDCFYAAIECRDDPAVAGKPVGVGGSSGRGVLTTCNYEARRYGCRSAMPVFQAKQLCPSLILKPVRFEVYRRESAKIRGIFRDFTRLIEPLSLDEAFLDVTEAPGYAWDIAKEIRHRIFETTRLTASAGVSTNKMLAKIASDWRKPNGQFAILPEQVEDFMRELPVRKLWGVGPKSAAVLKSEGVETCGQLQRWSLSRMIGFFGEKGGRHLFKICRGEDDRLVESVRWRKSLSNERTLPRDVSNPEECQRILRQLLGELREDLARLPPEKRFYKIFVKLKFADFKVTTRESISDSLDTGRFSELLDQALKRSQNPVRLIGSGVRFPDPPKIGPEQLVFPFVAPGD